MRTSEHESKQIQFNELWTENSWVDSLGLTCDQSFWFYNVCQQSTVYQYGIIEYESDRKVGK